MKKLLGLGAVILALLCAKSDAQEVAYGYNASTAVAASLIAKTAPGRLIGYNAVNSNAAARWVLIYDAIAAPADGTTTPVKWFLLAGTGTPGLNSVWIAPTGPVLFTTGIVFVCSSTGPYTKTAAVDCAFSAETQ